MLEKNFKNYMKILKMIKKIENSIKDIYDNIRKDENKIGNTLNKFKDDMKDNMNKLNGDVENINKYTENTDDKQDNIKKELDDDLFEKEMLDKRDKSEEKYPDMPYLETEEEAAENIADINERRKKIKKMILTVNMIVTVLINMAFIKILMYGMI